MKTVAVLRLGLTVRLCLPLTWEREWLTLTPKLVFLPHISHIANDIHLIIIIYHHFIYAFGIGAPPDKKIKHIQA